LKNEDLEVDVIVGDAEMVDNGQGKFTYKQEVSAFADSIFGLARYTETGSLFPKAAIEVTYTETV
jgi:hypothetical protein